MKNKIIWWSIAVACALGLASGARAGTWIPDLPDEPEQPQVMVFEDGTKLTLLGVTHGKEHIGPHGNRIYTPSNSPVVWIRTERGTNRWQDYTLLVSDKKNTACVTLEVRERSHIKEGVEIYAFVLDAFPRWDQETVLRASVRYGDLAKGEFVITNDANAAAGLSPDWVPKPLPDTESDGDVAVTLTKFIAGAPAPKGAAYYPGRIHAGTNDPANECVRLNFDIRQNGGLTTNWQAWPVRTLDVAGNQVRGLIYGYPASGVFYKPMNGTNDGYFYQPGLWPDASAWKVRMELIRRSGYGEDEMVAFTNLPVRVGSQQDWEDEWSWDAGKTNFTFIAEGRVNGVRLKMLPPLLTTDETGQKHVSVILYADPEPVAQKMNLSVVRATDELGHELWLGEQPSWAGHFNIEFIFVRDIKTLNLKLALHKSRLVEFTVKPGKE